MKNFINYFYNFNIEILNEENDFYTFYYNENYYLFKKVYYDESYLREISKLLNNSTNESYGVIISNKDNSLITVIDGKFYSLVKFNFYLDRNILLSDLNDVEINRNNSFLENNDWLMLWKNKIDFIENNYYFNNLYKNKKTEINYFIGLGECAISYLNEIYDTYGKINKRMFISHKTIDSNMNLIEFYDPTNLIIDYKIRDVSEFIKSSFLNNRFDINEMVNYIELKELDAYDINLFYVRILFPNFYFDSLINNNSKYNFDREFINSYEVFLKNIYDYLSSKYKLFIIDWIKKM